MAWDEKRYRIVATVLLLVIAGCGPLGGGETLESAQVPTPTRVSPPAETPAGPGPGPGESPCGDGVCDGPENAQNCPQDCAPTEVPSVGTPIPPTPSISSPGRARVRLEWRSSYNCQADDVYAEMEFTWSLADDGALTGSGEGTMYAEPVSRCPDTDLGGVRTPEPYPVTVTSTVTASQWLDGRARRHRRLPDLLGERRSLP